MNIVSLCSGTDSGAHALVQLLGVDAVNVLWSVDKAPEAFQWARANMRPSHYFEKMDNINEPSASCFICGETTCSEDEEEGETMCSAINELQPDVAIVTLPCPIVGQAIRLNRKLPSRGSSSHDGFRTPPCRPEWSSMRTCRAR